MKKPAIRRSRGRVESRVKRYGGGQNCRAARVHGYGLLIKADGEVLCDHRQVQVDDVSGFRRFGIQLDKIS